jgi:hypothetical protein
VVSGRPVAPRKVLWSQELESHQSPNDRDTLTMAVAAEARENAIAQIVGTHPRPSAGFDAEQLYSRRMAAWLVANSTVPSSRFILTDLARRSLISALFVGLGGLFLAGRKIPVTSSH